MIPPINSNSNPLNNNWDADWDENPQGNWEEDTKDDWGDVTENDDGDDIIESTDWFRDPLLTNWNGSPQTIPCIGVNTHDRSLKVFSSLKKLEDQESYSLASIEQICLIASKTFNDVHSNVTKITITNFIFKIVNSTNKTSLIKEANLNIKIFESFTEKRLFEALKNGSETVSSQILNDIMGLECSSRILNSKDETGNTPLHLAASSGMLKVVQQLLESNKVKINNKNSAGLTPLFVAVQNKNVEIVKCLCEDPSIDVLQTDSLGRTAYHEAALIGKEEIYTLEIFIKKAKSIYTLQDADGNTPLHLAARQGYLACCVFLVHQINNELSSYAYINKEGQTSLHFAAKFGHADVVQYLLSTKEASFVKVPDHYNRTPFMLAYLNGQKEVVELFPDFNIGINEYNAALKSLITLVSVNDRFTTIQEYLDISKKAIGACQLIVTLLGKNYSQIDIVKKLESTIQKLSSIIQGKIVTEIDLHRSFERSIRFGEDEIAYRFEIENSVKSINESVKSQMTNLKNKQVKELIETIKDPNFNRSRLIAKINEVQPYISTLTNVAYDSDGNGPLHVAAHLGKSEIINLLISNNIPITKNDLGQMPIHLAAQSGDLESFKTLYNFTNEKLDTLIDKFGRTPLHMAAESGSLEICQFILNSVGKPCLFALDKILRSPIHYAALKGHVRVVEFLVNKLFEGVEESVLNIRRNIPYSEYQKTVWGALDDKGGLTPLHLAAEKGFQEVCVIFLNHPLANRLLKFACLDNTLTPVAYAVMSGNIDLYKTLLLANVNCTDSSSSGQTMIHLALRAEKPEMAELLIGQYSDCDYLSKQNENGRTALHIAAELGYRNVVNAIMMVDREKTFGSLRDKQGRSARQVAHPEILGLLDPYKPSIQDARNACNVLEMTVKGMLVSIKDKVPSDEYLNNFKVVKLKCQLILEALQGRPFKSIQTIQKIYMDSKDFYSPIKRKSKELISQIDALKIEEMAKEIAIIQNELQPSLPTLPVKESTFSEAPYIIDAGELSLKIDLSARELFYKDPQLISNFKETVHRIQNGDFSTEVQDLFSEFSQDILSQAPMLTLILLHVVQTQEKIKNANAPKIFKLTKQFAGLDSLTKETKTVLQNPQKFKKLASYLINSHSKQTSVKISKEDEEEFQELHQLLLSVVGNTNLSQNEFGSMTRCFLPIFIKRLDPEHLLYGIQLHIQAGSVFQAELLMGEIPNHSHLKITAIHDILHAYLAARQWKWSEPFIDRIPMTLSEHCLPEYFKSVFTFANAERPAIRVIPENHLKYIWNRMLKDNIKVDDFENAFIPLGSAAVEFFKSVIKADA